MVGINNLTTVKLDEELVKKVAKEVLEGENKGESDLSIVFVGQARMRELNKKYRGKNRATDVLSFQGNGLGELVICLREVKKNAKRFNSAFEKELAKVLIHGILHLSGYEHEKSELAESKLSSRPFASAREKEEDKMREKEEHYLSLCQGKI